MFLIKHSGSVAHRDYLNILCAIKYSSSNDMVCRNCFAETRIWKHLSYIKRKLGCKHLCGISHYDFFADNCSDSVMTILWPFSVKS